MRVWGLAFFCVVSMMMPTTGFAHQLLKQQPQWTFHYDSTKVGRHGKGYKKKKKFRAGKKVDFYRDFPKVELPDEVDLRNVLAGGLSQIENQGGAGNCWAFA